MGQDPVLELLELIEPSEGASVDGAQAGEGGVRAGGGQRPTSSLEHIPLGQPGEVAGPVHVNEVSRHHGTEAAFVRSQEPAGHLQAGIMERICEQ